MCNSGLKVTCEHMKMIQLQSRIYMYTHTPKNKSIEHYVVLHIHEPFTGWKIDSAYDSSIPGLMVSSPELSCSECEGLRSQRMNPVNMFTNVTIIVFITLRVTLVHVETEVLTFRSSADYTILLSKWKACRTGILDACHTVPIWNTARWALNQVRPILFLRLSTLSSAFLESLQKVPQHLWQGLKVQGYAYSNLLLPSG